MLNPLIKLATRRNGATAIEYALLAGLIALALIGAFTTIGTTLNTQFYGPIAGSLAG